VFGDRLSSDPRLGFTALRLLGAINLADLPRGAEITMDGRIIATTMGIAALMGVVLGTIPVMGSSTLTLTTILPASC
jgi:hypothetical protein